MKKVDFLFVYEVKNRELENICLIAAELEKRGYSTAFINSWKALESPYMKYKYSCEVCIISAGYNTGIIKYFSSHAYRFKKIINLQWEQFMTEEKAFVHDTQWFFKEDAENIYHISWGQWNVDRLVEFCGLPAKNIFCCGHPGLDFYNGNLKNTLIPKEQLLSRYNLDKFEKVGLFVSSFTLINLPDDIIKNLSNARNIPEQLPLSVKSQQKILDWFVTYLSENKNHAIIYRPHPAEKDNPLLADLCKRYENFFVLGNEPIKHWINACDLVYVWFSTSLGEIWTSGKSCYILRPLEWTPGEDIVYYKDFSAISDYSEFSSSFQNNSYHFPISNEIMKYFYSSDDIPSYIKICDSAEFVYKNESTCPELAEEVYKSNRAYLINSSFLYKRYNYIMDSIAINLNLPFQNFKNRKLSYHKRHNTKKLNNYTDDYTQEMIFKNYANEKEILSIKKLFKKYIVK